jgi:hypothetical protein
MNFRFYKRREFSDLLSCHLLFKTHLVFKIEYVDFIEVALSFRISCRALLKLKPYLILEAVTTYGQNKLMTSSIEVFKLHSYK